MTIKARNRTIVAVGVVAAIAIAATLLPVATTDLESRREVRLVIRDMTYYLEGTGEPNPTLQFRRGERIRLILTNEDAGMEHDFVVRSWKLATEKIDGRGEDRIDIRVPRRTGTTSYVCSPHAGKMRGNIVVQ